MHADVHPDGSREVARRDTAIRCFYAIPAIVRDRPDTTFDIAQITVDGLPMIDTYTLGLYWTGEHTGNNIGGFVNAYISPIQRRHQRDPRGRGGTPTTASRPKSS